MLVSAVALSLAANAQDSKKGFYLKAGGSYFIQTVPTNFPEVGGLAPRKSVYNTTGKLLSSEEISGSFGEGVRTNLVGGYRFTERLGFEMGVHYYMSNSKTMADYTNRPTRLILPTPLGLASTDVYISSVSKGEIRALDLSPSAVLYLGEVNKFEPYAKVGVIIPVYGYLDIKSEGSIYVKANNAKLKDFTRTDRINPKPTLGFMSAIGTSYKITSNLSAFGEIEYRNFTVRGKNKEVIASTSNGVDDMATLSVADIHTNYVDVLDVNSNNMSTSSLPNVPNKDYVDPTRPREELGSYVSISGVGLTLGMRYNF